ncbi:hypothetical protein ACFSHT_29765 [Paraburkholderia silviterrae]|uniref:Uncharacterized protein n=1 Tax=Paraburkholderia silviterrae TaxID=2528715 RepID=A0A4R5M7H6_9BURK|nr:hypothetical protein [Paraburkholderia silviterrae]TDG22158.1 hypothetical protein EYW47_19980 [Paraburkholderia silviterrae]
MFDFLMGSGGGFLGLGFFVAGLWGVGLSLFSCRYISVAPVRGGTYFSLQPQRKVGKRKRLKPPV